MINGWMAKVGGLEENIKKKVGEDVDIQLSSGWDW